MLATPDDAIREFAWTHGAMNKDQEWFLHDWDVWVLNPHFVGKPGPHPEDDHYDEEDNAQLVKEDLEDEIPF